MIVDGIFLFLTNAKRFVREWIEVWEIRIAILAKVIWVVEMLIVAADASLWIEFVEFSLFLAYFLALIVR